MVSKELFLQNELDKPFPLPCIYLLMLLGLLSGEIVEQTAYALDSPPHGHRPPAPLLPLAPQEGLAQCPSLARLSVSLSAGAHLLLSGRFVERIEMWFVAIAVIYFRNSRMSPAKVPHFSRVCMQIYLDLLIHLHMYTTYMRARM